MALSKLREYFSNFDSALVTFSGGVDSTVLAKAAHEALGRRAAALTAASPSLAAGELEEARALATRIGIQHLVVSTREIENPNYVSNPANRCFFCKTELFALASEVAREKNFSIVVEGTHPDDLTGPRPGLQAARAHGVKSPFLELGIGKSEIRDIAREWGLPNWDKPALACLSSRFPTGISITVERLGQVDRCEQAIRALGFSQVRARYHGKMTRIKLLPADIQKTLDPTIQMQIARAAKAAGFETAVIDLIGYRR